MVKYSRYPDQIDTTTQLPLVTDNVTAVKGEVVNRLQNAILAIQTELGVDPSGTYSTVKARLDALNSSVGSGGSGVFAVYKDSTIVESQATSLSFVGNLTVTQGAPHQAVINIGSTQVVQERLTVSSNGQTSFTLSQTPFQANTLQMFVNGLKQTYGSDFTVSSRTVTYSGLSLITSDKTEFWYVASLSNPVTNTVDITSITALVVKSANYTILNSDYHISADSTLGAFTIELPDVPVVGSSFEIKDANGTSGTYNITIDGNGYDIDGDSSYLLNSAYQSLTVRFNGTGWSII